MKEMKCDTGRIVRGEIAGERRGRQRIGEERDRGKR